MMQGIIIVLLDGLLLMERENRRTRYNREKKIFSACAGVGNL